MKRLSMLFMLLFFSQITLADQIIKPELDKVFLTVSAKEWVKTDSAQLVVTVNATLNNTDMVKARENITAQLQTVAKGEWHITQFNRSQDNSGLEKLSVRAQARVKQPELNQVYQRVKSISKPGITYRVSQINFEPGLKDIERSKLALRQKLYAQVTAEIQQLNKQYPKQNYTLNRLVFAEPGQSQPQPMRKARMENTMMLTAMASAPPLAVSNELTMRASVVLASNRTETVKK